MTTKAQEPRYPYLDGYDRMVLLWTGPAGKGQPAYRIYVNGDKGDPHAERFAAAVNEAIRATLEAQEREIERLRTELDRKICGCLCHELPADEHLTRQDAVHLMSERDEARAKLAEAEKALEEVRKDLRAMDAAQNARLADLAPSEPKPAITDHKFVGLPGDGCEHRVQAVAGGTRPCSWGVGDHATSETGER